MLRPLRKGQSTAEYAIVIGLVIAAAVAMQIYVKRGLQAKVKGATDWNEPTAKTMNILGKTSQFEPDHVTTTGEGMYSKSNASEIITTTEGGSVKREISGADSSSRTGVQVTRAEP